ncbi:MAG: hypothetical protein A3B90_03190 [Candidatus Magasanikbacteria bacterium RIFCSPHIGHO2_02_FULL_41_13]|uniref:Phosphatidic acid phosphatase type 2/haloperoxidase domain-containing protein n=1 Tax=Candidatus Magasanikbacteria bacterium RIFCSPHIGHO2_02_FULL_41_13 TaxID=1798676 RepID=A0A1F6M2R2_9BACT|nr:MAG: hypothetical protein A3B90_03190 [Candidatus Magasanikbacteria bacterium RIFCSPHIGHO2_02_FULL_41_13]
MILNFIISLDLRVNALLLLLRDPLAIKFFHVITFFGEVFVVGILALLASALLWRAGKKYHMVALWLSIIGSEGITFLLKISIQRARPLDALVLETSNSFPSGHATLAIAFYGFIAYLLLQKMKKSKYRIPVFILFILFIFAIGFSRLYLGVHYLSDVCVGSVIGLVGLVASIVVGKNKIFQAYVDKFLKR